MALPPEELLRLLMSQGHDVSNVHPFPVAKARPPEPPPISKDPWFENIDGPSTPITENPMEKSFYIWAKNKKGQRTRLDGPYYSYDGANRALISYIQNKKPKNITFDITGPGLGSTE